ncbi:hypothetical protein ACFU3J_07835 [Streptomyces sp. NPDC057411]|uniref:hypothetical protein n=1 Tax=unclassified Streptomyces TaxID=2593676 RepID=UPI0036454EA6
MLVIALSVVLALALVGCGCVVWAARGGPRWARGVAAVTLAAGEVVRRSNRPGRRGNGAIDGGDGGDGA